MGVHGSPMGDPWVSYGLIWVFIRAHGPAWASMGCHGSNGYPMNLPWVSTHGFPWNSHKLYNGLLWNPIGLPRAYIGVHGPPMGHPWVTVADPWASIDLPWALMGLRWALVDLSRTPMGLSWKPRGVHGLPLVSHGSPMDVSCVHHRRLSSVFHGLP